MKEKQNDYIVINNLQVNLTKMRKSESNPQNKEKNIL